MKKVLTALLLFLGSHYLAVADDYFPPPFSAQYKLYARGFAIGEGTRRLYQQPDGKMVYEAKTLTTGVLALFRDDKIEERSLFSLTPAGKIQPLEYSLDHTGSKKQKHVHITFDWPLKKAKNTADSPWELTIPEGTLDDQLYQIALMQDLQQGKRELSYTVADDGKIKVYRPTFVSEEKVRTDLGEFNTLKYERVSSDKKRRTTLWCAPVLHYLPVQVEHLEKGDTVRMVLQSLEGLK